MTQENDYQSVQKVRLEKLNRIKAISPIVYQDRGRKDEDIIDILDKFDKLTGKERYISGRIMAIRKHGKAAFVDIKDDTAQIQAHIREDVVGKKDYGFFDELIDIGDFLEMGGMLFKTKRGEETLEVKDFRLLSKSLSPLPEKWKGLQDAEKKHRYRYLDLLTDDKMRNRFRLRAKAIDELKNFMNSHGFLEVETPTLQVSAGGALTKPFITHYNAFDMDVKLRISLEIPLKKLLIAGYEKVYEIGRVYRNEGRDPSHIQEFTMFEFYQAYVNYEDMMMFTEKMMKDVLTKVMGNLIIKIGDRQIDMTPPYPRKNIFELIDEYGGHDLTKYKTAKDLREFIKQTKIEISADPNKLDYGKLIDEIYKKIARPKIDGPVFLIDHPIELSPLARKKDDDPTKVDRFQLIVNGWEILNAYSELIDPIDQENRFREQIANRAQGDEEAHDFDSEYIEAMKYGMPPICGWGMGIDRFMSLLTGIDNLRELILFPFVKPKDDIDNIHPVANENVGLDMDIKKDFANEDNTRKNIGNEKSLVDLMTDEELDKLDQKMVGITRDEALVLMKNNLANENLQKHSIAVEAILREIAERIGADSEVWGIAGLLHDIDYEKTMKEPTKHCIITAGILEKQGVSPLIIQAIKAHNPHCGGMVKTRLDQAILAIDPLSGFITACALVTPEKKLSAVTLESMMKKFKMRSFAKGADREAIMSCEKLGLKLDDFLKLGLEAMQKIKNELGL